MKTFRARRLGLCTTTHLYKSCGHGSHYFGRFGNNFFAAAQRKQEPLVLFVALFVVLLEEILADGLCGKRIEELDASAKCRRSRLSEGRERSEEEVRDEDDRLLPLPLVGRPTSCGPL